MIISDSKLPQTASQVTESEPPPPPGQDQPPNYTTLNYPASVQSPHHVAGPSEKPHVKPSNFFYLLRDHQPIKETIFINPSLIIPASLLPPLADEDPETDRKNLKLTTNHGHIDVEIHLHSDSETDPGSSNKPQVKQPVTLVIHSHWGSVNAKMHAPDRASRSPFQLTVTALHRGLTLHLPRSFRGPLTITAVHRSPALSDQLCEDVTIFGEVKSTRRCFVGDFSGWDERKDGWQGDEVTVYSETGKIRLQYVDEVVPPDLKGKGFLARLMGL